MSYCFTATFVPCVINGKNELIRHNTRLWFNRPASLPVQAECVGAVVGLNPGSAKGEMDSSQETVGYCDATMSRILSTFKIAYSLKNKAIPNNAYIQMLNLFYLRDPDSCAALNLREKNMRLMQTLHDPAESRTFPFFWLAWGQSARPEDVARFLSGRQERCCWVDSGLNFHYEPPKDAGLVRHPLCRTKGFTMRHNAEMIAQMLV